MKPHTPTGIAALARGPPPTAVGPPATTPTEIPSVPRRTPTLALVATIACSTAATAQEGAIPPRWIWFPAAPGAAAGNPPAETRHFRKPFQVKEPSRLVADVTADNGYTLSLDGQELATGSDWKVLQHVDVAVPTGFHVLAAVATNEAPGPAAFLVRGGILPLGQGVPIHTDPSWKVAPKAPTGDAWMKTGFDDSGWVPAADLGVLGTGPWTGLVAEGADPSSRFRVPEGFTITQVAAPAVSGSAVSFAFDDRGRPCVGIERGPIVRLIDNDNDGQYDAQFVVTPQMSNCQGLYFDAQRGGETHLWAVGDGPKGTGIYRWRDADNDGAYDEVLHYVPTDGMGEHGPHAITRGPDGLLYFNSGNHSHIKEPVGKRSPVGPWFLYEGEVLPHYNDSRGHAAGIMAPCGEIYRSPDEGKTWERVVAGFRNQYDFAFNRDGEIFSFDSDMEWDIGLPWYRPVRVTHSPPGAEHGSRNGSGAMPSHFYDTLPSILDVGRGSPTGVTFYQGGALPPDWDDRFLICDWSQGRILAVKLDRSGASYKADAVELVSGQPLNCTDVEAGPDGAIYFTNGGRGTTGGLFRVAWKDAKPYEPAADPVEDLVKRPSPLSAESRRKFVELAVRIGPPKSVDLHNQLWVIAHDEKRDSSERVRAIDLLCQVAAPESTTLLSLIRDADPRIRGRAVTWLGDPRNSKGDGAEVRSAVARALGDRDPFVRRLACESIVRLGSPSPTTQLLPLLGDYDRYVRYAARVAIEHGGPDSEREFLLTLKHVRARLEGLLALLRATKPTAESQRELLAAELAMAPELESDKDRLAWYRLVGLTYLMGPAKPSDTAETAGLRRVVAEQLERLLAAENAATMVEMAREQARLLAALDDPAAVPLIQQAQSIAAKADDRPSQIHFAYCLRAIKSGWTPETRLAFWNWLETASHWDGGFSYLGYLDFMGQDLLALVPAEERAAWLADGAKAPFPTRLIVRGLSPEAAGGQVASLAKLYEQADAAANPVAVGELRGLIVEKLGQVGSADARAALRHLAEIDPDRRDAIARSLAVKPDPADVEVLADALATRDPNTVNAVLGALAKIDRAPDGPDGLRNLIRAARRFGAAVDPVLASLGSRWTGTPAPTGLDHAALLAHFEAAYAAKFPNGPALVDDSAEGERNYTLEQLAAEVLRPNVQRRAAPRRGKLVLTKARCLDCHKFGDEGQGLGPDLTTVSSRFKPADILESIVHPSKVISDQYLSVTVAMADGRVLNGMPAGGDDANLVLLLSDGTKVTLPKADVEEQQKSSVSVMPEGLLNLLTPQEIADMLALFDAQPRVEVPPAGQ